MDPTTIIEVYSNDIISVIQTEIAQSADSIYKALSEKITADIRNQINNKVTAELHGQTLFEEPPADKRLPVCGIKFLRDEYVFLKLGDGSVYTNYGRILDRGNSQTRDPCIKLTKEIMDYISAISSVTSTATGVERTDFRIAIIDKYNSTYAFASNDVHEKKVAAIRAEIEEELADKFRSLEEKEKKLEEVVVNNSTQRYLNQTQSDLLAFDRKEFEAEVAKERVHRKTTQELETSQKQIDLIKHQLARQASRLHQHEAALAEKKTLERLRNELDKRALLMNLINDDLLNDSSSD